MVPISMTSFRVAFALVVLAAGADAQEPGAIDAPPASLATQSIGESRDPLVVYGKDILFDVFRNGAKVGQHQVTFERHGEDLVASSRMTIAIKVMFITGYRFNYNSVETWDGARLKALDVSVDDDGKKTAIHGRADGQNFRVTGGKVGEIAAPAAILPTTHWNSSQPAAGVTLDTLDGVLRPGPAERIGTEQIRMPGGPIDAVHFAYTGGLKGTEVWYADARWVQLRFRGRDGSVIEYRCVRCGV